MIEEIIEKNEIDEVDEIIDDFKKKVRERGHSLKHIWKTNVRKIKLSNGSELSYSYFVNMLNYENKCLPEVLELMKEY